MFSESMHLWLLCQCICSICDQSAPKCKLLKCSEITTVYMHALKFPVSFFTQSRVREEQTCSCTQNALTKKFHESWVWFWYCSDILFPQKKIEVREWISHLGLIPKVIPHFFLEMPPVLPRMLPCYSIVSSSRTLLFWQIADCCVFSACSQLYKHSWEL